MSSFYGYGGVSSGGSGSGTTNYNALSNTPITNLEGTLSSPVILNQLAYGNYLIKGYYIYTSKDKEVKKINYQNLFEVAEDISTARKIVKYETFEEGKYYIYTIECFDDDTCLRDKLSFEKTSGVVFLSEKDLPETGTEGVLYTTENTIYQWIDGEGYVDLNEPLWTQF